MAESNESTMKFKIDTTDFNAGMKQIKEALADVNREFRVATAGMGKWQQSSDGVEAKISQLTDQIELYRAQQKLLNQVLEEAKEKFGENSFEADQYKDKVADVTVKLKKEQTDKLAKMREEQNKTISAFDQLTQEIADQQKKVDDLKNAYKSSIVGNNPEETERLAKELAEASSKLADMKQRMADATNAANALDASLGKVTEEQTQSISKYKELNNEIAEQQQKVDDLKEEYASAVLQYGKNSTEAQELAKQLKALSTELADNKKKMNDADKAADNLDQSIDEAGESAKTAANGGFTVLKGALANLVSQGINRLLDGFKTLTKNALDYQKSIESYEIAFSTLTGSAEKASSMVGRLGEIVKQTPFDMPTLADATNLLMNYGFTADEAIDKMMMLGDISQGNSEKLGRVALAYGQMNSAGKVLLQDLKQMIEAGFNPLQEISDRTGESMASLYDRISKGTISVDEINEAFVRATSAGGKYYQSMNKQSQSFQGRMEALQEQINNTLGKTFEPLLRKLSDRLLPRVTKLIKNMDTSKMAKGLADFGEKAIEAFEWIVANGNRVIEVLHGIAVAFVTYKAVSIISSVVGAFQTLIGAIKTGQTVMMALNTAFGLTPVGLLATGVAGLVGTLAMLAKRNQEALESQHGLNAEQQAAIDKVSELTSTYYDLNEARKDQLADINTEFGHLEELKTEYNGLIDSNGKVKEGYEDRAKFILTTLAEAMGMELKDLQKLIDKNGQLGESIDKVIEKKKAEALLAANEQLYNQALKERATALTELADAQKVVEDAEKTYTDAQEESKKVMEEFNRLIGDGRLDAARKYYDANQSIINGEAIAKQAYEDSKKKVEEAELAWLGYNNTIKNYEGLAAAIISGDADKINEAMANMTYNFITAENGNRESLERQVENYKINLENLELAIDNGTPYVTEKMVNQAKSMVEAAEAELDKLPPEASAKGTKAGEDFANSMGSKKDLTLKNAQDLVKQAEIGITPAIDLLNETGAEAGGEFGDEVASKTNKDNAKKAGEALAKKSVDGAKSENGEEGGATTSGKNFTQGFINGIKNEGLGTTLWNAAKNLAKKALDALKAGQQEGSPSKLTRQSGIFFGQGYELGILDMIKPVTSAASNLARQAADALGTNLSDQMRAIGVDGGNSLIDGMKDVMPDMSQSIGDLKASVASANASMTGQGVDVGSFDVAGNTTQNVVFNQTINSPKAVDRITLYRETNSLLFSAKVRLNNV